MPPRHPAIARALGFVRAEVAPACRPGQTVLVAWSGGPDSATLLGLLRLVAPSLDVALVVGHVDHGLRAESEDEAAFVRQAGGKMGVPVAIERLHIEPGAGVPARARAARRAALRRMARAHGAAWIALGHTATDQIETTLMHLVRGAGLGGLAAMPGCEPGRADEAGWLRPVLSLSRAQTRELARRLEIPFVDDPSNDDPRHFRVCIRQAILPLLRQQNPRLEDAWCRAVAAAQDAERALDLWCGQALQGRCVPPHVDDELEFGPIATYWSVSGIPALPRAVRTRMIRTICLSGGVEAPELGAAVIDAVDSALRARPGDRGDARVKSWDLHPRRRLRLSPHGIWVEDSNR